MKTSAGILLYRFRDKKPEFFLVHPGGPFFKGKEDGAWSIPKGEFTGGEDPLEKAKQEFEEETSFRLTAEAFIELNPVRLKSGKKIFAWAAEDDVDHERIRSNTFLMAWPPRSGQMKEFPEVDKAGWFDADEAKEKLNPGQVPLIEELVERLKEK
jgi:predicted NUDIX family NTP pyrophosphohydrolase